MSLWSSPQQESETFLELHSKPVETVTDFEDLLELFANHGVRYLIVGGLAVIYHAKPRYTRDIDLWVDPEPSNVERANQALAEFGSPYLLTPDDIEEVLQLGVAPSRVDLLRKVEPLDFAATWQQRIDDSYGRVQAHWIDLDSLIEVKSRIDSPRHQEDARVLRLVRDRYR